MKDEGRRMKEENGRNNSLRGAEWLLILLALCVSGCRYTVMPPAPGGARTVFIPVFRNDTLERGIECALTSAIAAQFAADGRLRPVSGKADLTLTGKVVRPRRESLKEDKYGTPVDRRSVFVAEITLVDAAGKKLLDGRAVSSVSTDESAGLCLLRKGQTELSADKDAVDTLARNIVRAVVELW